MWIVDLWISGLDCTSVYTIIGYELYYRIIGGSLARERPPSHATEKRSSVCTVTRAVPKVTLHYSLRLASLKNNYFPQALIQTMRKQQE